MAKPARYIGLELGAQRPEAGPGAAVAAHLPRHLRDRPQPGPPDPLRDPQRAPRRHRRAVVRPVGRPGGGAAPSASSVLGRHPPAGARVRRPRLQPVGRADLHQPAQLRRPAGVPVRSAERRPEHPLVAAGGHCTYNPSPLADFLDFVVLGDGEEVVSEITAVVGSGRRRAAPTAAARPKQELSASRACTSRRCTRSPTRAPHPGGHAPLPRRPRAGREAHDRRPPTGPTREPARPAHRGGARPAERRGVPGCTWGCRFCQAGMITRPVRERPADQVRVKVSDGLRRTGYDEVALTSLSTADFSGIEDVVRGIVDDPASCGQTSVSLPACGSTPHHRHRRPDPEGPPHRLPSPRGRHLAHAPDHQQAHPRRGPLRRGRERSVSAGAGSSSTSPGCRRRPTRTRSASSTWPATASTSAGATPRA